MAGEGYISVECLVKKFGKLSALNSISFNVDKGEIYGLIGPNGAGKSTFISILTTLLKPTSGDICIAGSSVVKQPSKIRTMIGFVPQEIALYPTLSGMDNLKFWGGMYGLSGKVLKIRIDEALEITNMKDRALDAIQHYSGGMKRRMNIAVALLHHPDVLVMDEPTVGVDILSRKFITDAILNLKKEGRTVIYTSHYIDEMELICDRIAIINRGELLKTGTIADVRDSSGSLEEAILNILTA